MNGYAGKILRVNLTTRNIGEIPTSDYEDWGGGHGIGSAIFFDLVKDKTIDGLDPENVVTIMTSPLSGTLVPCASGRTEVQGIGVQSYPVGWYTRSNLGGRFGPMLKYSGWDGVVIEGASDTPVWLDIRDDDIQIRECGDLSLWGTDTHECQETIWNYVAGEGTYGSWSKPDSGVSRKTTQTPAVLAIGPAGENLSRMACLIHDVANAAGQGGFGAVFGSKNLKAISVIGTGSVTVADPGALLRGRITQSEKYAFDPEDPPNNMLAASLGGMTNPPVAPLSWGKMSAQRPTGRQKPKSCMGCLSGCRTRFKTESASEANEINCLATRFYSQANTLDIQYRACNLLNQLGINAVEVWRGFNYIVKLKNRGVLGQGKEIDCPLDFSTLGSFGFAERFLKMISYGDDGQGNESQFGNDIHDGFIRAAEKWGRLEGEEGDFKTGLLEFPYWGCPDHGVFDPRGQLEWGYGSILGERDVNEHDFTDLVMRATLGVLNMIKKDATAEEAVTIFTDKMEPYDGDPADRKLMLDYSDDNMYSAHIARFVSWHRHFTRFYKQSLLFCDMRWSDMLNPRVSDKIGSTGVAEPEFFNAVTGKDLTFLDGMEIGKRIWNLDQAIWTLQGRHRDMVHFADYVYAKGFSASLLPGHYVPGRGQNGKWRYINVLGRRLDREKFEEFKTRFYEVEGWDPETGYPTRSSLESLGLGYVADELESNLKLGSQ